MAWRFKQCTLLVSHGSFTLLNRETEMAPSSELCDGMKGDRITADSLNHTDEFSQLEMTTSFEFCPLKLILL